MAEPASASTALIATGDGPAALYGVGQSAGGAVIQSIGVDHVVLSQAGQAVRLDFPSSSDTTLDIASAPTAQRAPPAAPPLSQEVRLPSPAPRPSPRRRRPPHGPRRPFLPSRGRRPTLARRLAPWARRLRPKAIASGPILLPNFAASACAPGT
ncbi:type II secretion system protein N [Brevundimonas sp.]